jgi:hypothetical protein
VLENSDLAVTRQLKADGIAVGDANISRPHGPPANAIVAIFRTMARSRAISRTAAGMLTVGNMTGLRRAAKDRASQKKAGQQCANTATHCVTPTSEDDPLDCKGVGTRMQRPSALEPISGECFFSLSDTRSRF